MSVSRTIAIGLVLALLGAACARTPRAPGIDPAGQPYFPGADYVSGSTSPDVPQALAWYAPVLARMHERSLAVPAGQDTTYRLLAMPTFAAPFVVRVAPDSLGRPAATYIVLRGQSGYPRTWGGVARREQLAVPDSTWQSLAGQLTATGFFTQQTRVRQVGLDGTYFLLEVQTPAGYHAVERWSDLDNTVRPLIDTLERLTGDTTARW